MLTGAFLYLPLVFMPEADSLKHPQLFYLTSHYLATSDESGILNAPALNPLRRVLFFPGILVYNSHASLNNWHLLRQQRQPMAHDTKLYNSDDSAFNFLSKRCKR